MVQELLSRGKGNAVTTEELMRACNFSSKRELTQQVAKEREEGAIICSTTSGNGGYFLPKSREEIREFVNSMDRRAKNTFKAVKNARKILNETDGQMNMNSSMND